MRSRYDIAMAMVALLMGCGGTNNSELFDTPGMHGPGNGDEDGGSVQDGSGSTSPSTSKDAGADEAHDAQGNPDGGGTGGCGTGLVQCGGACVDIQHDTNNCGRCAHDCLGTACWQGTCNSLVIATDTRPTSIAADGVNLYWTADARPGWVAQVERSAVNGQTLRIAGSLSNPKNIRVFGKTVVFDATGIYAATVGVRNSGRTMSFSATQAYTADPLGEHIYTVDGTGVYDCSPAAAPRACALIDSVSRSDTVDSLYLNGRDLFWPDLYKGAIRHLSLATGISEDFATNQVYASSITGDGQNLYWIARGATGSVLVRSPMSNAVPTEVGPAPSAGGLTTDGKYLYWYDRFGGTVGALLTTGGLPFVIGRSGMPSGLAIDDQAVYWTDDDGSIRKVAKP